VVRWQVSGFRFQVSAKVEFEEDVEHLKCEKLRRFIFAWKPQPSAQTVVTGNMTGTEAERRKGLQGPGGKIAP
jgi:hypothetical protein